MGEIDLDSYYVKNLPYGSEIVFIFGLTKMEFP